LEEYASCGVQTDKSFDGKYYISVYEWMLVLIDQVKSNPYHSRKFEAFRRKIAARGM